MKKILIIDNDPTYANSTAEFLQEFGYQVSCVFSVDAADTWLERNFCHLLLVDIRLSDNEDNRDASGIQFISRPKLAHIPKISITAYPSEDLIVDAMERAVGFASKIKPEKLLEKVDHVFANVVAQNWGLVVLPNENDPLLIKQYAHYLTKEDDADLGYLVSIKEELLYLFRQLFPNAIQVRLERILWLRAGRLCCLAYVFYQVDKPTARVVVFGALEQIIEERKRFKQHHPEINQYNTTIGEERATHVRFAANTYVTVDGNLEELSTLKSIYMRSTTASFAKTLRDLFQQTLKPWHDKALKEEKTIWLGSWFKERLGKYSETYKWLCAEHVKMLLTESLRTLDFRCEANGKWLNFHFETGAVSLLNPVNVLENDRLADIEVSVQNTSGHIYEDNILCNGEHSWLTDFLDAGPAPVVRDFLSIEGCIRYEWCTFPSSVGMKHFEDCLVHSIFEHTEFTESQKKAAALIREVRGFERKEVKNPATLDFGLFYHAIARLISANRNYKLMPGEVQKAMHVLYSASLYATKLLAPETLPKLEQEKALAETEVSKSPFDEFRKTVTLHGNTYHLSQRRFALLKYLYQYANQLCTHQDIGEHVWPEFDAENGGINKLRVEISRLRKDIGDHQKPPQIIITEPNGEGYCLVL